MDGQSFGERVGTQTFNLNAKISDSVPVPVELERAEKSLTGAKRWAASQEKFFGASETYNELPPGLYRTSMSDRGPMLVKQKTDTDKLIPLPDDDSSKILEEFRMFWSIEKKFKQRGFLHKRGFLLWGPPGSGKTSCVNMMAEKMVKEDNGVVLMADNPGFAGQCLQMLRHIEDRRPVVMILEDLDALVRNYGENEFLALMDGEAQVDRIVFVATTNYPEHLEAHGRSARKSTKQ